MVVGKDDFIRVFADLIFQDPIESPMADSRNTTDSIASPNTSSSVLNLISSIERSSTDLPRTFALLMSPSKSSAKRQRVKHPIDQDTWLRNSYFKRHITRRKSSLYPIFATIYETY